MNDDRPEKWSWKTNTPGGWRHWALAGHASATTEPHIDSSGLCTWVHLPFGEKLWFIGGISGKSVADVMRACLDGEKGIVAEKLEWECAYLKSGDDL